MTAKEARQKVEHHYRTRMLTYDQVQEAIEDAVNDQKFQVLLTEEISEEVRQKLVEDDKFTITKMYDSVYKLKITW